MPYKDKEKARECARRSQRKCRYSMPEDGWPIKTCVACPNTFKPIRRNQIYCGSDCYEKERHIKNYRSRWVRKISSDDPRFFLESLLRVKNRWRTLTIDDLISLWEKQKGLCALSGQPMTHLYGQGKILTNVSIDRIKHGKEYTKDNIRLVCNIVNTMRHSMSDNDLFKWCDLILEHNRRH